MTSFLSKHINNLVLNDDEMINRKDDYRKSLKHATEAVLKESKLSEFIDKIQVNYSANLRDNNCNIQFGLPEYEDIFLEMMFKIGLNGNSENLIPIDHFGDGYISMFVMAVIQAIAETNTNDKCLFLFEEPESFLHENHQEYFYKTVLCGLSENGHQVIYTTHSHKMIDIFDTRGLIRVEFDEDEKRTIVKYNRSNSEFNSDVLIDEEFNGEIVTQIKDFNNYIKMIEPNLNKLIFSRKVLLVEGSNDLMVYKELIHRLVLERCQDKRIAETFLNFNNIVVIPHHGKITALVLVRLCKHLGIEYYLVNDFDFEEDYIEKLNFDTEDEYKDSEFYKDEIKKCKAYNPKGEPHTEKTKKAMMTTNWKLVNEAGGNRIHFNVPKLEKVIGYNLCDKDSSGIWNAIQAMNGCSEEIFPKELIEFLEIDKVRKMNI